MGLLNHCLPILSTLSRSSFMFGKQLWKPFYFLLDTWKPVLSKLAETFPPEVPKRFAKSPNFSLKSGEKWKKILGKVRSFQIFHLKTYNAILTNLSETSTKFLEKSQVIFFARNCYISPQDGSSKEQKFLLEKHPLIQKTILKERARGKTSAADGRLFWIIKMIFSSKFMKLKETFLQRWRFLHILANYTASCTILKVHNFESRTNCHQKIAHGLRLIAIDIVQFLRYDRKICFCLKTFFLWEKRWRCQSYCRMRMKWNYLLNIAFFLALKGYLSRN